MVKECALQGETVPHVCVLPQKQKRCVAIFVRSWHFRRSVQQRSGGAQVREVVASFPAPGGDRHGRTLCLCRPFSEVLKRTWCFWLVQDEAPTHSPPVSNFPYSQKLFHIANGTLYSVFSPTHGRSCGMKPNFLARQRGSTRESRGRGRRSTSRCLKFHNFIPSESITSEKDDGCQDDVWKVHAECRLQEEHGTKQIMVSQWSLSSDISSSPQETKPTVPPAPVSSATQSKEDMELTSDAGSKSATFPNLFSSLRPSEHLPKTSSFLGIQDELFGDSGFLCSTTQYGCDNGDGREHSATPSSTNSSAPESTKDDRETLSTDPSKRHRRKPVQTRRVIPYNKYLSLMEDDECPQPLDLSFKANKKTATGSDFLSASLPSTDPSVHASDSTMPQPYLMPHRFQDAPRMFQEKSPLQEALEAPLSRQASQRFPYSVPHHSAVMMSPYVPSAAVPFGHALYKTGSDVPYSAAQSPYSASPVSSTSSTLLAALQEGNQAGPSRASPDLQRSLRKPSQRSLIKQKLEDTFKQNGFLVKTKQVSDGDATFCKFRQLRKYTRYYLKSWHHHLPAEVHKLWKGFLPPKTLPGSHVMTEEPKEMPESQ